ncbi:MAG: tetratricopeptide repeat protein [Betaproteobacteria bacterium]|nr:tetratricopeptide repeat protein [Betaproteobacteria bacterium]
MNLRPLAWLGVSLGMAACAQVPVHPGEAAKSAPPRAARAAAAAPDKTVSEARLPKEHLTPQVLYEYLLAEMAAQRGQVRLAADAYLDLARRTHDPRIAERATQVALYAREPQAALGAARIWAEADPQSKPADQTVAILLAGTGHLKAARPRLERLLAAQKDPGPVFLHMADFLANVPDKQGVLSLVSALAARYPRLPEAHFAVAEAAWAAQEPNQALDELRQAARLRPGWELAAVAQARLLAATDPAKALQFDADYLARFPQAAQVRLAYAKLLSLTHQDAQARAQFVRLAKAFPQNPEMALAAGLLSLQLKDYGAAHAYLEQTLSLGYRPDGVKFYLGQLAEARDRTDQAKRWYLGVDQGPYYMAARMRYAALLAKEGHLDEAVDFLGHVSAKTVQEHVQIVLAQAELLRDANDAQRALGVLTQALATRPDNTDLLYDRALTAVKLGRLRMAEADLRTVIRLKPHSAQAYNALGYTLADKTRRFAEARQLIGEALKLSPNDPFIIDSMGWVEYRMGHFAQALRYLKRAYAASADPEIAAHLGAALWKDGQPQAAHTLWTQALKANPGNAALERVMKKFGP